MEPFRLKLKSGIYEFEAEGEQETVKKEAADWRAWVDSRPSTIPPAAPSPPPMTEPPVEAAAPNAATVPSLDAPSEDRQLYAKIFSHEGRVVSLTVIPKGMQRTADSMLMVLFGQYVFNGAEPVTGQQVSDGMRMSGVSMQRVDRGWGPHMDTNVLASGVNRGIRYRLSNTGLARAREIAREMLEMVP